MDYCTYLPNTLSLALVVLQIRRISVVLIPFEATDSRFLTERAYL